MGSGPLPIDVLIISYMIAVLKANDLAGNINLEDSTKDNAVCIPHSFKIDGSEPCSKAQQYECDPWRL